MPRWTSIPATRSSAPILKIKLYAVLGLLGFAAFAGVLSIIVQVTSSNGSARKVVSAPTAFAAAEAYTAASQFVAGEEITIPIADDLVLESSSIPLAGVDYISPKGFTTQTQGNRYLEMHRFLLSGTFNNASSEYWLVVPLELTFKGKQVTLVGVPALEVVFRSTKKPTRFDWTSAPNQITPSKQVTAVVRTWATAYLANDRQTLQEVTGGAGFKSYAGLGGFSLATTPDQNPVKIVSFVLRADKSLEAVVRVQISAVQDSSKWSSIIEYDLLLENPNNANPKITAWGPPGTGGLLVPYQNAYSSK